MIIPASAGYWRQEQAQPSPEERNRVTDAANLTDAERARLEQRRDRLMKLMKDGDGEPVDSDDRADLVQEWNRIDALLNRR